MPRQELKVKEDAEEPSEEGKAGQGAGAAAVSSPVHDASLVPEQNTDTTEPLLQGQP